MTDSVDPVRFYDGLFDKESKQILDAFGDQENRAMFAYLAENGESHLDEVYSFLSESEVIENQYGEDFDRENVKDIRGDMHLYVSQRLASDDFDSDDVYFELTTIGEEIADSFNVGGML